MRLWGDSDYGRSAQPATTVSLILLLVAALLTGVGIATYRYEEVWTPLQRQYLSSYVWSAVLFTSSGSYSLLQLEDPKGRRLALDDELVTVRNATGDTSLALSDAAVKAGGTRLVWQREPNDHAALHRFLGRWIYQDQTLFDLAQPALWGALALFLGGVLGARSQDVVHARSLRARYPARKTDNARAPAIIEYVPRPPASAGQPSNPAHAPIPHGCQPVRHARLRPARRPVHAECLTRRQARGPNRSSNRGLRHAHHLEAAECQPGAHLSPGRVWQRP